MLRVIDVFTPVKVEMMKEEIGLDESIHGEHAYETLDVEELFSRNRSYAEMETPEKDEEHQLIGSRN